MGADPIPSPLTHFPRGLMPLDNDQVFRCRACEWSFSTKEAIEDHACMATPGDTNKAPKDTNPKTIYGQAKTPLSLIPGAALVHCAESFRDGADKYGPANWRVDPVSASTYMSALLRHFIQWQDGEECDPQSGVHHLGSVMANAAILIDAMEAGTLLDDRPPAAPTAALIRTLERPIKKAPANG